MKFGKLSDISNVDFSLPPDPPANSFFLQNNFQKNNVNHSLPIVYVGCTGWSMKEWVGKIYPPKTPAKDFLTHYSRQFNTIEFNTTHYRTPAYATVQKWKEESADDFRFCPKILQAISHSRDLAAGSLALKIFCDAISLLEEKLGCCFIQLPPYFGADRLGLLEHFLKRFPKEIKLAVEVRHESWFADSKNSEALFSLLEKNNIATVITDVAGRRDVLHSRLTTNLAMIRFVGNGLHPTDYERIDAWVQRLKKWLEQGLEAVYFFTHEPDNILAPELALYLVEQLQQHCQVETRGPKFYQDDNQQMSLF